MKNEPFSRRLGYSLRGIRCALAEASFRTQCVAAFGAILLLIVLKGSPKWWALFFLAIGAVLSAELVNTALELLMDRVHPSQHPMIGKAKDCAAGAVLVLSLASLGVAAAFLWDCSH